MPTTREEHVSYTRNELENYIYYIKMIEILKANKIESYIDIGANVGEFCNVLFEKIPTLKKAYLIEPEKNNFEFLKNHVNLNNILFLNLAIGYNLKSSKINFYNGNFGGFKLLSDENEDGTLVEVKTLEDINLPIVDFVKIDVEGGEYNIIPNSLYLQKIKWIEIEFHDYYNIPTKEYVANQFKNHQIVHIESLEGRCLLEKIK
jgi:FkbM family methyltransferase